AASTDIVIVAVPFPAVANALRTISNWRGRIVVDATNAIALPSFTPADLGGRPSSEIVAHAGPGALLVKAFNRLPAAALASDPAQGDGRRVIFTSSDDADASAAVGALCERLGFYPISLGRISEGGRLQEFGGPLSAQNLVRMD